LKAGPRASRQDFVAEEERLSRRQPSKGRACPGKTDRTRCADPRPPPEAKRRNRNREARPRPGAGQRQQEKPEEQATSCW
jgi:hypothetical protein